MSLPSRSPHMDGKCHAEIAFPGNDTLQGEIPMQNPWMFRDSFSTFILVRTLQEKRQQNSWLRERYPWATVHIYKTLWYLEYLHSAVRERFVSRLCLLLGAYAICWGVIRYRRSLVCIKEIILHKNIHQWDRNGHPILIDKISTPASRDSETTWTSRGWCWKQIVIIAS